MTNRDFRDLLAALSAHDVRFLVVGGYAVTFHALEHLEVHASVPSAGPLGVLSELPALRRVGIGTGNSTQHTSDLAALQQSVGAGVDLIVR